MRSSRLARSICERQALQQPVERLELVARELRAEKLLDVAVVRCARGGDLLEPCLGEHGIGHPLVARAAFLRAPAGPLEPVEEARDARGREEDLARQVDPAEAVAVGVEKLHENVEIAQRQAVGRLEARGELARGRCVSPEEPHPDLIRYYL